MYRIDREVRKNRIPYASGARGSHTECVGDYTEPSAKVQHPEPIAGVPALDVFRPGARCGQSTDVHASLPGLQCRRS